MRDGNFALSLNEDHRNTLIFLPAISRTHVAFRSTLRSRPGVRGTAFFCDVPFEARIYDKREEERLLQCVQRSKPQEIVIFGRISFLRVKLGGTDMFIVRAFIRSCH
jgi:hypothetical protein